MTDKAMTTPATSASSTSNQDQAALALKSNVIDGARELTDEMKHMAGDVAAEAKKSAESGISAGKKRAADGLVGVANAIRKTGEHLRAEDQGTFTPYFDSAARQVDAASDYLQTRTLGQVIGDIEQFARREPALFLGGAFVAGLVGGRFLKSSRPASTSAAHAAGAHHERAQEFDHAVRPRPAAERGASTAPNDRDGNKRGAAVHEPSSASHPAAGGQGSAPGGNRARETNIGADPQRSGMQSAKPKAAPSSDPSKPKSASDSGSPKTSGAT